MNRKLKGLEKSRERACVRLGEGNIADMLMGGGDWPECPIVLGVAGCF